jgi:tetratricopeptide (TPR) repeat protein
MNGCLTDETLTDYLEGRLDPAIKMASEAHLVSCDHCRTRLAFFMQLLNSEVKVHEEVAIRAIQERWVQTDKDQRLPGRRGRRRNWRIASGAVAAALLLTAGMWFILDRVGEPRSAGEVIHLLLARNRPFEARISGQPYLPFTLTRGISDPGDSDALLARQMSRLSATAYEMGQFYLLEKDFKNAITYLELASREPGATAETHNDLGVAYMESSIDSNQSKAIAEFRRALGAKPNFLPAVFNLAVLYERLDNNDQAENQWKQYLQLESDHSWKDEAKAKLERTTH